MRGCDMLSGGKMIGNTFSADVFVRFVLDESSNYSALVFSN